MRRLSVRSSRSLLLARPVAAVRRRLGTSAADAGMTTAEYAVGTVAACGFGGVLWKVIESPQVLELITGLVSRALKLPF